MTPPVTRPRAAGPNRSPAALTVSGPVRTQVRTADTDAAHAILGSLYGAHGFRLSGDRDRFRFETRTIQTNLLRLDHGRHTMTVDAEADPSRAVHITRVVSGRLRLTAGGDTVAAGPGQAEQSGPDAALAVHWSNLRWQVVRLDAAAVVASAADLLDIEEPRVRFALGGPLSPVRLRYWQAVVDHLTSVFDVPEIAASPLGRTEAFRMLAGATLSAFPNSALEVVTDPNRPGPGTVEPAAVRRALAFIDAHAGESIGLAQIAAAARVGPRGLQLAFRRHRDTTPLEYVRTVRMEGARADLLAADPTEGDTVARIASRWGFLHHGHFAADYRRRYGCPPSSTLRGY
jgi:AraC-like DNA-binding protein